MFDAADSQVINTEDAQLKFALMHNERMDAVEDQTAALETRQKDKHAQLEAKLDSLWTAVKALPRLIGYFFRIVVPTGTTQQQMEEGLKAGWAELGLATDGVSKTGFCVTVMTEHDFNTRAYVQTTAQVLVFGAKGIMPHQANQWVMSSVAGSAPWGDGRPEMLNYEPEIEYFRYQLSEEQAWVMHPRAANNAWAQEPVYDGDDDQSSVEEWMDMAYPYSKPWVGRNGEEYYAHFS